jgi:hypothetical protein
MPLSRVVKKHPPFCPSAWPALGSFCARRALAQETLDEGRLTTTRSPRKDGGQEANCGPGCADVLYGVTMQEPGVSRRIAVRFEDWPDDEAKPEDTENKGVA